MDTYKYHGGHSDDQMASTTTISLRKETKELLRKLGSKGQTYDEVIRELIEKATIKELDARWNRILEDETFTALDEL
jgi:predicted CopG family antitoxin